MEIQKIIKNKKSKSISITLLVFMALLLSGATLFVLLKFSFEIDNQFNTINSLNSAYAEFDSFQSELKIIAKQTLANEKQPFNSDKFVQDFQTNYINYVNSVGKGEKYKDYTSQINDKSKYNLVFVDDLLQFKMNGFVFKKLPGLADNQAIGSVIYTKDISFEVSAS